MPTRLMPSSIPGPTLTVHPGLRPAPPPPLTSRSRSWPATPFAPAFFASDRHPAGTSRAPARLGRSAAEIERGPARARQPPLASLDDKRSCWCYITVMATRLKPPIEADDELAMTIENAARQDDGAIASSHLAAGFPIRSEEHTSELQSLMRISYAVFCLKKKKNI